MRSHRRYLWLAALAGFAAASLPSIASSATTATVEAINEPANQYSEERHHWEPPQVAVTTSTGKVTFINSSMTVPHGIVWNKPPATPSCEEGPNQVPVSPAKPGGYNWKGACTFSQEGVYSYYCSVHGLAMSGTVYVNASGTIPPPPPTANTGEATSLTEMGATLNGTVNPNGQPTFYYFNYGKTASYGEKTPEQPAGEGTVAQPAPAAVSSLSAGTVYHFQLVATYASGKSTTLGADRTFTTVSPPGAPAAITGAATSVTETGATLAGTVNPDGQPTTYVFKYGTTTSYGQSTEARSADTDKVPHAVSVPVSGLLPGTTYHFELVAENASGPAPGADRMFTTASLSSPPSEPSPSTTTSTPPPPPTTTTLTEPPPGPPIAGSPSLRATQHGSSVRGSLNVSQTGAGGHLEVDLLAKSASLATVRRSGPAAVRVGRLVRASVSAGKVSFSVPLTARGKSALRRHHRLALTVKITLTPTQGAAVSTTRSVTLRA
jgi:plastocyanin